MTHWLPALVLCGCVGILTIEAVNTTALRIGAVVTDEYTHVSKVYDHFFETLHNKSEGFLVDGMRFRPELLLKHVSAENATAVTQQLLDEGVKLFLGPPSSSIATTVAATVGAGGGVLLSPSTVEAVEWPGVYSLSLLAQTVVNPAVELLMAQPEPPTSVAFIQQEGGEAWWTSACSSVETLATQHGMTFHGSQTANDPASMAAAVAWLDEQQPDLIVVCLGSGEGLCEAFLQETSRQSLHAKATVVAGECPPAATLSRDLRDASRWMLQPVLWSPHLAFTSEQYGMTASEFAEWYRSTLDVEPPTEAAAAWAACEALVLALEKAESQQQIDNVASHVISQLQTLDLETLFGRVTFDAQGQLDRPWKVMQLPPAEEAPRLVFPVEDAQVLLYTGRGRDPKGENIWEGWYTQGLTDASGDGKRREYDTMPIKRIDFTDDGGRWAAYQLYSNYHGQTLLHIVRECMGDNRSNIDPDAWRDGFCVIGKRLGSFDNQQSSPELRLGVGGDSGDEKDWILFKAQDVPVTQFTWGMGSQGKTNGGHIGQVSITGTPSLLHYPTPPWSERDCYLNDPADSILGFVNSSSCSPCPKVSTFNIVEQMRLCKSCADGEVVRADGEMGAFCDKCQAGRRWRPPEGSESDAQCEPCRKGTFSRAGSTYCEPCPPGQSAEQDSAQCHSCPAGQYTPIEGSVRCLFCPEGKFAGSAGQSLCEFCLEGWYSPHSRNRSTCLECDPGKSSSVSAFGCTECAVGKHQPDKGQGKCIDDSPGLESPDRGTATPTNKEGYWMTGPSKAAFCHNERFACLKDGKCKEGHTGRGCYSCLPGYSRGLFTCFKCPHVSLNIILTVVTLALSVVCVLWAGRFVVHSVGSPQDTVLVVLFRMGINHCVTMTILQGMLAGVTQASGHNVDPDYVYAAESLGWVLGMFDGKPPTETSYWSLNCLVQGGIDKDALQKITSSSHAEWGNLGDAYNEFILWQSRKEALHLLLWVIFPCAIVGASYAAGFFMLERHMRQRKQLYTEAVEFYWNVIVNSLRVAKKKLMEHQRKQYVDLYFQRVNGIWSPADHMLYSLHYRQGRCWRSKISYALFRQETHLLRNIVLFMTYASVSRSFLRPMVCLEGLEPDDSFFMRTSPELPCTVDNPILWVSGIVGTAYLIVMPTFLYVRLWLTRDQLHLPTRLREWGLSTCGYKADYWWWEPIVYLRKALCIALEVVPNFSVSERLTGLLVIALAYLLVTHACEPYDERCRGLFNWLEQLQLVIFVVACVLLKNLQMAIQWEDGYDQATNNIVLIVPIALVLMHVGFLLYLGYHLFDVFIDMAVSRMTPEDVEEIQPEGYSGYNKQLRRRIKRWMFARYQAKAQASPYVSLDPMYGWVSLVGSHGATAVPPYIPKGQDAVARLRDQGLCRIPSVVVGEDVVETGSSRQVIAHKPQERRRTKTSEATHITEEDTSSVYFDGVGRQMRIFLTEAPLMPDGSNDMVGTVKVANLWTRMELRNILVTAAARVATGQEASATISTSLMDFVVRAGFALHQKHRTALEAMVSSRPQEIEKHDWLAAVASSDPAKLRGATANLEADDLEEGVEGRIYMASALLMEEELHDKFDAVRKMKLQRSLAAAQEVKTCCLQCARRSAGTQEAHAEEKSRKARERLFHERETLRKILHEGAHREQLDVMSPKDSPRRGPDTVPQNSQEELDMREEVEALRARSMELEKEMRRNIKHTRYEAVVDEMFRPSNYRQGVPLNKLEFALLRLQSMSREDLSLWLDIFEKRWMHETVSAQRDLARNCGQVRDSENEAILSKARKPSAQQVSEEGLATWQPTLACDEAVQCMDLDVFSPAAAKTLQMQQLEESLDAVEIGIYVRWALMTIELTRYLEISSIRKSLRPSRLASLEYQVKSAKDEADRESEKLSVMEWEYAQLLQRGQEEKVAKEVKRGMSKNSLR